MNCSKYFPDFIWWTILIKHEPESSESMAQSSTMFIEVAGFSVSVVPSLIIMTEEADSSAVTVHRSKQMMKVVLCKITVSSSTLIMWAASSSENMVQISKAIQFHIAKSTNINTVLPLFGLGFTKC